MIRVLFILSQIMNFIKYIIFSGLFVCLISIQSFASNTDSDAIDRLAQGIITNQIWRLQYNESAKRIYYDLKENGYYSGIISGNISQTLHVDSVTVNINEYPYRFRCYATQNIIRTTSILKRSLITQGSLRNVSRSDNNPHGFLIERWETIENKDIGGENRK